MKSFAFCPVTDKQINERVARFNAAFTMLLLLIFLITQSIIPVLFLAVDFLLRAADYSQYSLLAISSRGIVKYFSINGYQINAGPKLFAARIGFVFSLLIIVSFLSGAVLPAIILGGILGLFSFLESVFGLCVACEIYPYVYRILQKTSL
ncbi:MAG TPA: DUF4395 domain-containing protein [Bacteroidales bacterium]|nr:DUF4395 domain-containing protein [Bacteroidales bacterium]